MLGTLHVIKTPEKELRFDLVSSLKLLAISGIYAAVMGEFGMEIDHLAHLSGYVGGVAFGWLSQR